MRLFLKQLYISGDASPTSGMCTGAKTEKKKMIKEESTEKNKNKNKKKTTFNPLIMDKIRLIPCLINIIVVQRRGPISCHWGLHQVGPTED